MAVKKWLIEKQHGGWVIASLSLDTGDTSNALELPNYPQKTIHVIESTGAMTDLDLEGSNTDSAPELTTDNALYLVMHRLDDPTLSFSNLTASLLADLVENPRYIKVTAFASSGITTITVVAYTAR